MSSLIIYSTPMGATIYIDFVKTDYITPNSIPVTPGTHNVTLSMDGFQNISTSITVVDGRDYLVEADMQANTDIQNTQSFKISNEIAAAALSITVVGGLIGYYLYKNQGKS